MSLFSLDWVREAVVTTIGTTGGVTRIIPYVLTNSTDQWTSVWMNKHLVGPAELTNTRLSTASVAAQVVDPMLSPDESTVVYATIPGAGLVNQVNVIPADDSDTPDTIATFANANAPFPGRGVEISMQPSWHPDGSVIIYRTTLQNSVSNPAPRNSHIRRVEPDGTNDTLLLTLDMDVEGRIWWPTYNYDGTRIAMICTSHALNGSVTLATCDADGTNFAIIATIFTYVGLPSQSLGRIPFAWAHTMDTLAYYEWTGNEVHTIDGDGTNDTTIYTDADPFWGTGKVTWLNDDSAIVYSQYDSGAAAPKHEVGLLDPGGGGFSSLSTPRFWYGQGQNSYPRQFPQDGRIWWQEGSITTDIVVSSVLADGSDYTVEHDVDDTDYNWGGSDGFSYHL